MTDAEYFAIDRMSNSTLSWVKRKVKNLPDRPEQAHYNDFGKLAEDYIIDGVALPSDTSKPWRTQILRMKEKFYADDIIRGFVRHPDFVSQHKFFPEFMELPFKCKLDGSRMAIKTGFEYKTGLFQNYKTFNEGCYYYDYDRQVYVYMECANLDRMIVVGQSKYKGADIFMKVVKRGDDFWNSGKEKTEELVGLLKLYFV